MSLKPEFRSKSGNANRGVVGVFLKYPPQRKILKIPPSKFWENFKKLGKTKKINLTGFSFNYA